MIVSIETPVFKGGRLERCIESVLHQSSPNWTFSLLWDGGDDESRRILEELDARKHPNVSVRFAENRGIARARRDLTEHSRGDFILPLDDDDALPFNAVERFLAAAERLPWASVIRGQRKIIDEEGRVLDTPPWFPFEPRHYRYGMVTDPMNHTQPYLIRRSAYDRTTGWEGFDDFGFAGEDCDIYLKLEETGTIELLDETLYYYRVHSKRQSLVLTNEAAFEMWRRLADKTIARIGLPLERVTDVPPYVYEPLPRQVPTLSMVDFVVSGDGRAAEALKRAGVTDDAVHRVGSPNPEGVNAACRSTSRPLLCFVDAAVQIEGARGIEQLLRVMHERLLDLAAPKLVAGDGSPLWGNPSFRDGGRPTCGGGRDADPLGEPASAAWLSERFSVVRREVLNAVGGFDEGYPDFHMAMVDLCLRARQRDFKCAYAGAAAFTCAAPVSVEDDPAALDRLHRKWERYPDLFA